MPFARVHISNVDRGIDTDANGILGGRTPTIAMSSWSFSHR